MSKDRIRAGIRSALVTGNRPQNPLIYPKHLEGLSSSLIRCLYENSPGLGCCPIEVIRAIELSTINNLNHIKDTSQSNFHLRISQDLAIGKDNIEPVTMNTESLFKLCNNSPLNNAKHIIGMDMLRQHGGKILDPTLLLDQIDTISDEQKEVIIVASKILNLVHESESNNTQRSGLDQHNFQLVSALLAFRGESISGNGILFNQMHETIPNTARFFNTRLTWSYLNTSRIIPTETSINEKFASWIKSGIVDKVYGGKIIEQDMINKNLGVASYEGIGVTETQKNILQSIVGLTVDHASYYFEDLVSNNTQGAGNKSIKSYSRNFIACTNIKRDLVKLVNSKNQIYLMRHGMCQSDVKKTHDMSGTSLFLESILDSSKKELQQLFSSIDLPQRIDYIYTSIYPRALETTDILKTRIGSNTKLVFAPGISHFNKNSKEYEIFRRNLRPLLPSECDNIPSFILWEGLIRTAEFIESLSCSPFSQNHFIVTHSAIGKIIHHYLNGGKLNDYLNNEEVLVSTHKPHSISCYSVISGKLNHSHLNATESFDDVE